MKCFANFILLAITALVFLSCRSSRPSPPLETVSKDSPDVLIIYTFPPVRAHFGHIVRTNTINPERPIKVIVTGDVKHGGKIEIPEGTSVLEAIKQAGGFGELASRRIELLRNKARRNLMLRQEAIGGAASNHYFVWCDACHWDATQWKYVPNYTTESDFVLEPDDVVIVPHVSLNW